MSACLDTILKTIKVMNVSTRVLKKNSPVFLE